MGGIPAIIVPYRDRAQYLDVLLAYLPRYLTDHGLEAFHIVISEQADLAAFRLALCRNVGATFALRTLPECDYFVFNDVDVLPFRNVDYGRPQQTTMWFMNAGSCKVPSDVVLEVNGYNNEFAGWGYEDTEFSWRLGVFGLSWYDWHTSPEARGAEVVNLECAGMTDEELDAETVRYFGSLKGPRFVAGNGLLEGLAPVDKRGFFAPSLRDANRQRLEYLNGLPQQWARAHIAANGIRQILFSELSSEPVGDRVWRVRFDSRTVCGGVEP